MVAFAVCFVCTTLKTFNSMIPWSMFHITGIERCLTSVNLNICPTFRFIPKITAAMPNGFMPGKKRNKSGGGGTGGSTSGGNGTAVA